MMAILVQTGLKKVVIREKA
ncbi:hypothetical protein Godav_023459 [Gossypium davidsonii]|uniref:Uncharacterized protein n=1 Tax=Gossypium davidsonii TaxID=34287 RepID=A0A7J8STE8_GOSDV|nr:hypothetical protein [Gossypium davidsonii]